MRISFNPIFVLPITEAIRASPISSRPSMPITHTPGRRTGTGSANIQSSNRATSIRIPIIGFRQLSLLSILQLCGKAPPFDFSSQTIPRTLEDIRKNSDRPIVVFPECTTSNGRGLLRFADVFRQDVPVKDYQVFVMCVRYVICDSVPLAIRLKLFHRYDPPTILAPTATRSIPSSSFNPLPHVFTLASSITLPTISIRLLAPSDSPGSQLFIASEVIAGFDGEDQLSEACAALIAQIGKMKRVSMGWEDKISFLEFYRGKRK